MSNNTKSNNNGTTFVELLQLMFIGLKLSNVINWSWWWVLSPTLITVLIVCLFIVYLGVKVLIQHIKLKKTGI